MKKILVRVAEGQGWSAAGEVHLVAQRHGHEDWWRLAHERAFLIRKDNAEILPDWDDYPDWAQWRAVDRGGELYVYDAEPTKCYSLWNGLSSESELQQQIEDSRIPCPNWADTLEERPKAEEDKRFIPCTPGFMTFRGGPQGEVVKIITKPLDIPFQVDLPALSLGEAKVMQYAYREMTGKKVTISTCSPEPKPEDFMDFVCGGELKSKSGPYSHSSCLPGGYRLGPQYGHSPMLEYYNRVWTNTSLGKLFGSFKTKEENEMDCPRTKILTAPERIEEKLNSVRNSLKEHVERENERIAKLDTLCITAKKHEGASFEDEIVATLLREADQV